MKRAALYVRVSTQEQKEHGISVDSQIDALEKYCKEHGLSVFSVYNDAGISARKKYKSRPELLRLMQDCKEGKIDIVLFTKLDRWFRSVADYYEVQSVLDNAKVPWRAIWEDYETETSAGVFKVNIMLSIAQAESDRTSERIRAVNEYRRAKGEYVGGSAPMGYAIRGKQLVVDENMQPVMQKFFNSFFETFSVAKAIDAVADQVCLSRNTAYKILNNETYSGIAQGYYSCFAYITPEQHQLIQRRFDKHRMRKSSNAHHTYVFAGLLRCKKCGKTMSGCISRSRRNGTVYKAKAYRCVGYSNHNCDYSCIVTESTLEKYLLETLNDIVEQRNYMIKTSRTENTDNAKKIAALQKKLSRVGLRFEIGDLSKEKYLEKRQDILRQLSDLQIEPEQKIISLPVGWQETYKALDYDHKKAYWNTLIKYIVVSGKREEKTYDVYC